MPIILSKKFIKKYAGVKEKLYLESFTSKFRPILNEMEGDIMTLKIMSFNNNYLKLFNSIYRDILFLFKNINDTNYQESLKNLINFVTNDKMRNMLKHLQIRIDQFILDNSIEFSDHPRFTVVKIQSIRSLIDTLETVSAYSFDAQEELNPIIVDNSGGTKVTRV